MVSHTVEHEAFSFRLKRMGSITSRHSIQNAAPLLRPSNLRDPHPEQTTKQHFGPILGPHVDSPSALSPALHSSAHHGILSLYLFFFLLTFTSVSANPSSQPLKGLKRLPRRTTSPQTHSSPPSHLGMAHASNHNPSAPSPLMERLQDVLLPWQTSSKS